jgi:hypothetical protein
MTTVYSSWQGTSYQARIRLDYTRTYTADNTQAIWACSWYVEFGGSISDSVNTWSCTGDVTDESGSNVNYSIPSGGGTKLFNTSPSFQKYGDASVTGKIDNVEAVGGGIITGTFALDSGALAPYFTDSSLTTSGVTSSAFTVGGYVGAGNGGTLNNIQVQYNTTASATGATTYTKGSYGAPTVSGLAANTTYYFRIRISNSTFGYSAYSAWYSVKTASGLPGVPATTWSFGSITQVSAAIAGNTVADNGGSAITGWDTEYNTSASSTGSTVIATAGPLTGLTPYTTYYARIRAKNVNGAGPWSDWKSFTTLESAWIYVTGVGWRPAAAYVCTAPGVWKIAERYVAVSNGQGGVNWKT